MAQPAFFLSPRYSDVAVLSASSSGAGTTPSNMQKPRPRLFWRSATASPSITADLGTIQLVVNTIVIGYHNMRPGDTIQVRFATTQSLLSTPAETFNNTVSNRDLAYALRHHVMLLQPTTYYRWMQIVLTTALGYAQIGRLMFGYRVQPATSVKTGWAPSFEEPIIETMDMGGEEAAREIGTKRALEAQWHSLLEADQELAAATLIERGSSGDIALVVGTDNMSRIVIGRVKHAISTPQIQFITAGDVDQHRFSMSLKVSELGQTVMI